MRVEEKNLHVLKKYHWAMAYPSALASLVLTAQLAGVDVPRPVVEPSKRIFSIGLDEIGRRQSEAFAFYRVGREDIGFSAAVGPDAGPWIKLIQKNALQAAPLEKFAQGLEMDFPHGRYRFIREQDDIRAMDVDSPQMQPRVPVGELIDRLYLLSAHVRFPLVEYAVMHEGGGLLPAAVSLLRRNDQGTLMVTHFQAAELNEVQWFLSVNALRYCLKIERERLIFYSTPAPMNTTRIERPYMR